MSPRKPIYHQTKLAPSSFFPAPHKRVGAHCPRRSHGQWEAWLLGTSLCLLHPWALPPNGEQRAWLQTQSQHCSRTAMGGTTEPPSAGGPTIKRAGQHFPLSCCQDSAGEIRFTAPKYSASTRLLAGLFQGPKQQIPTTKSGCIS